MTREARQFRCPENVLGWIPWYEGGGLSAQQRGQVEAHAAECSDCRVELDIVSGAPFEIDVELPDPNSLFDEIAARIDGGERDTRPTASLYAPVEALIEGRRTLADDELDRIGRWVLDSPMDQVDQAEEAKEFEGFAPPALPRVVKGPWPTERIGLFAAAAALAIFFVGGVGGALLSSLSASPGPSRPTALAVDLSGTTGTTDGHVLDQSARVAERAPDYDNTIYHSATENSATATGDSPGAMLDVVFLDSVSLRDVSEALRAVGAEIVSGPTSLGVYRVRLTSEADDGRRPTAADVAAAANRLKASGSAVAIFAEAVP